MARGGKREGAGRKAGTGKPLTVKRVQTQKTAAVGIKIAAMRHAEKALTTLVNALTDDSTSNRITAAKELLDRAYGKPSQTTKHEGDPENPLRIIIETGVPR